MYSNQYLYFQFNFTVSQKSFTLFKIQMYIWITYVTFFRINACIFLISGACSLRLRDFNVPAVVMRGDPVRLNCSYDLELDTLYSIKWHKNNIEFYRYLPEDNPPAQKYELPGIYLDVCRFEYFYDVKGFLPSKIFDGNHSWKINNPCLCSLNEILSF